MIKRKIAYIYKYINLQMQKKYKFKSLEKIKSAFLFLKYFSADLEIKWT